MLRQHSRLVLAVADLFYGLKPFEKERAWNLVYF
jgi:hypothetical protein